MRLSRLVVILLVLAAIVLVPVGMALGQQINPVRVLPATVERGGTFNVTITFTAVDNFTGVSLNDIAPAGWNVTPTTVYCQPSAIPIAANNVLSVLWMGGSCHDDTYCNNTNFTVLYQVTVPCDASGYHTFTGVLYYYIWPNTTPYDEINEAIGGNPQVQVIPPAICSTPSIEFYAAPGQNPANETLELWSSTPCPLNPLNWSLTDDADYLGHDWLSENRTSGNCTNVSVPVQLSVNTSGMPSAVADYSANITINATDILFSVEANNSPHNVTVILHITDKSTLQGQVDLCRKQDPGDPTWETPLVVRFFDNSTKVEMGWSPINITTDAYGNFTIGDIAVGTYDIGIKNWTSLSKMAYGKDFTAGNVTAIDFGLFAEGDTDNDDQVKLADFNRILANYGARPGDGNWNAMYDFNRSGKIDLADFNQVLTGYGQKGDIYEYLLP